MPQRELALCITDLLPGGAERRFVDLAVHVDRSRFRPVVYCLGPRPPAAEAECVDALDRAEVETHFLGARSVWSLPSIVRKLRKRLASQGPQIMQSFLFHANIVSRIAASRAGAGTVVAGIRVAERQKRWHLWLDRRTQKMVDRYVCVSHAVARFSAERAKLPTEKLVVIPNGIDVDRYPASPLASFDAFGVGPDRRAVVFIGRLERQKGVVWLIDSADRWLQRLPTHDLLLVGDGPLRTRLERLIRRRGLADRVHFTGWRTDAAQILAASDVLVLPSLWEGMPNVVLEAMASGLPVVATSVEGVEELLGPMADRQTVPCGDSQTLADRIVAFAGNAGAASEVGTTNRQRAAACFSLHRMVDAYQDLWESLVEP